MTRQLICVGFSIGFLLRSCISGPDATLIVSPMPGTSEPKYTESIRVTVRGQPIIPPSSTPSLTTTNTPENISQIEYTPVPKSTPISLLGNRSDCPQKVLNETDSILDSGSLLFSSLYESTSRGIWAVTEVQAEPFLVLEENDSTGYIFQTHLSPDGKTLAWAIRSLERKYPLLGLYDLAKGQFQSIDVGIPWKSLLGFSNDQRVILQQEGIIRTNEVERKTIFFDPITAKIEVANQILHLPDLFYEVSMHWISTFSEHPDGNFYIYTAESEEHGVDIILFDLQNQERVWEFHQDRYLPLPGPAWSHDGSEAALSVWSQEGGDIAARLLIINLDGVSKRLIPQYSFESHNVHEISWSPDDNYLYFALGHAPVLDGNGYILNLLTNELHVICDPSMEIFYGGQWVGPKNQFIYGLKLKNGQEELRLLDIESWEWQSLFIDDNVLSDHPFIIHGWSPILVSHLGEGSN